MLPEGSPSSTDVRAVFLQPDDAARDPLVDFEMGGIHVNDPSLGLNYQQWRAWATETTVRLSIVGGAEEQELFVATVTELSLTFDQNMRPTVAFMEAGACLLYWFDPVPAENVMFNIDDAYSPFVTLDDKRDPMLQNSDIILAYLRGQSCYYRIQRERFLIEHLLQAGLPSGTSRIVNFGMNRQNRLEAVIHTVY
jgi:hypothetical protein